MDNYIVSARKYRPTTFRSVIGQKSLTQTLKNAIDSQKLAHAYLFCGPRGVGKTTCARIFAKTINCQRPTDGGEACNECESCRAFNEQRSYNITELDAASNNSIDDIRNLIEMVRVPPQLGKYKVFIIDEVHMLSTAAFNSFLKTLEEPPHHAIFILATTEKHKILPTILSRCQIYDFNRIGISDTVEHLQYVAEQEGLETEEEALQVIAQKADGGMRDALSIFDQIASSSGGRITYLSTIENLNVLDYEYYFKMVEAFLSNAIGEALLLFDNILSHGFEANHFVTGLCGHFRDLLVSKDPITLPLLEVAPSVTERYGNQAAKCSKEFLYQAIDISVKCDLNYRISKNKRLLVEWMLFQLCQITQPIQTPEEGITPTIKKVSPENKTAQPSETQSSIQHKPAIQNPETKSPETKRSAEITYSTPTETKKEAPKVVARPGGIPSISIKKPLHDTSKENISQEKEETLQNNPFDEKALLATWLEFTKTIQTETILVNTMKSCPPQLIDATTFEVIVDNQEQMFRLNEKATDLMPFLRNELQNSYIKMTIRESEKHERQKAFSQREKFEAMVSKNSTLLHLRDQFGLELA